MTSCCAFFLCFLSFLNRMKGSLQDGSPQDTRGWARASFPPPFLGHKTPFQFLTH